MRFVLLFFATKRNIALYSYAIDQILNLDASRPLKMSSHVKSEFSADI